MNKHLHIYIKKTTEITSLDRIVFSTEFNSSPFYRRKITKPNDDIGKLIWNYFLTEKVFYQNNEIGEVVKNYINWCKKE